MANFICSLPEWAQDRIRTSEEKYHSMLNEARFLFDMLGIAKKNNKFQEWQRQVDTWCFKFSNISYKIWVDDERPMPEGYDIHCKTATEAIALLETGKVSLMSLDHDLGDGGGTGYDIGKFIEEGAFNGSLGYLTVRCHSANPAGKKNIEMCIDNAMKFWTDKYKKEVIRHNFDLKSDNEEAYDISNFEMLGK